MPGLTLGNDSPPLVFALKSTEPLGAAICAHLGLELSPHEERDFEDGEHKIRPLVSVRDRDAYVVHSLNSEPGQSVNDKLCKLLFLLGALRDAGAGRVTAVVPYLAYARKDRRTKSRDPLTSRYVAQLFEAMGIDRFMGLEVHNPSAFENAFRCNTEHLDAVAVFISYFKNELPEEPITVVSPDPGGMKRAEHFRLQLEAALNRQVGAGFMEKHRSMGHITGELFAGDVAGRAVIIIDDLISTGGTMVRCAAACRARGAGRIYLAATHAPLNPGAGPILGEAEVERIVVTDSVSIHADLPERLREHLAVLSVADLFGEAISRCHSRGSISHLLGRE